MVKMGKGNENMVDSITWEEFRDSGALWYVNRLLHLFGLAICLEIEDGKVVKAYPAKCKYRGFSADCEEEGYAKLTKYISKNIGEIEGALDC